MSTTHYNNLNPGEAERVAKLAEEAAEVIQIVGKIPCHGYSSEWKGETNRERLEKELGNLKAWEKIMVERKDISLDAVMDSMTDKYGDVVIRKLWVHHQ